MSDEECQLSEAKLVMTARERVLNPVILLVIMFLIQWLCDSCYRKMRSKGLAVTASRRSIALRKLALS